MLEDLIVSREIELWDSEFEKDGNLNPKMYELALFKIFTKLEVLMSKMFIVYATGEKNRRGYCAKRKLYFKNETHLKGMLKSGNKSFIDYNEEIKKKANHIFEREKNPFDLIFLSQNLSGYYNKIKTIRNYVAHESEESKNRYVKDVLDNRNFKEVYEHLTEMNRRNSKTNYSIYVEKIEEMVAVIVDPASFLNDEIQEFRCDEENLFYR